MKINDKNYFGHNCKYFIGKWSDEDDPDHKKYRPEICFCNHSENENRYEGNCRYGICPLKNKNFISAIKCKICESIVYSRARHDMRYCECKSCFIDGGQLHYIKTGGTSLDNIEMINIELDISYKELYDDWNKRIDKYGLIKRK